MFKSLWQFSMPVQKKRLETYWMHHVYIHSLIYIYIYMYTHTHTHTHYIYIYIYIYYRNTKVKVCSPDGETEYFDTEAGVLQGDTLAPYLFIICLDYVLRTSIDKIRENGFELTKKRSRMYPIKSITDAHYADDSVTSKYTQPSRNTTAYFGTSHSRNWPPCQCTQNRIFVL